MWKCKKCKGEDYTIGLDEVRFCKGNFNKDGDQYDSENDAYFSYKYVQCENCGETADKIQDIADWEEEDERD